MRQKKLQSWQEIAAYLECGVRTAQRWRRRHRLPVYQHGPRGRVFAFPDDLEAWSREFRDGGDGPVGQFTEVEA